MPAVFCDFVVPPLSTMGRSGKKQARRSQSGKVNAEDLFEEDEPRTAKRKSGKTSPVDAEPEEKRAKKKKRRSGSGAEAKMYRRRT